MAGDKMFKVSIEQVDLDKKEEIIIKCHEINDEVLALVNKLKEKDSKVNSIAGMKGEDIYSIRLKDVYYFEATENKTFIYCKDEFYETKLKLYEIEEEVKNLHFFRCSKSVILHYSKIDFVTPAFNGRFEAKLFNGEKVIISRQYVPVLKDILGI